jgi:phenylalanyl-tRNA synthetase beta chain
MPTIAIEKELLLARMGGCSYTDEAFDELCFQFGIELDEVTSEYQEAVKAGTATTASSSSSSSTTTNKSSSLSTAVIYKIDVPANRYDLLCVEGLARALMIFLERADAPTYALATPHNDTDIITMTVQKAKTDTIRPIVVCAILRDISFEDSAVYQSFMDLQDQLHRNVCRHRTLVAIGTHDLEAIQPPFVYTARPPTEINFFPLVPDDQHEYAASDLVHLYETDPRFKHLKPYVPIIKDSPLYPVIYDANNTVLSLPPLINGHVSKITPNTKHVFIECTGTDLTKATIVLDTLVTMFSQYCARPFTVEPVRVQYVDGDDNNNIVQSSITPTLVTRHATASVAFINSLIGIQLDAVTMQILCNKVQLGPATTILTDQDDTMLRVTVPPTRSDILHAVDVAEDIAIAVGYNNIPRRLPATSTVGAEQPLNHYGDSMRDELARAGYMEVLTHGLCSRRDNYTALQRREEEDDKKAVALANPANVEYQVIRTTLLPGLLKTVQHNKSASFMAGFKLFEISDVVLADATHTVCDTVVGCKNVRRVCAVYVGPTAGFEIIHGLVDRIMTLAQVDAQLLTTTNSVGSVLVDGATNTNKSAATGSMSRPGWTYSIAPLDETDAVAGTYFTGRAAAIVLTKPSNDGDTTTATTVQIGTFGCLHPTVLQNFDIQYPVSCVELDLECLL